MGDPKAWNPNFGVVGSGDRRLAYSRQFSLSSASSPRPALDRSDSSISMPVPYSPFPLHGGAPTNTDFRFRWLATRPMRRLALLLALNVAYSAVEFAVGLLTGRVGLVSDAFHLTFGCGLLSFSLFAMAVSRTKPDSVYTYGYSTHLISPCYRLARFIRLISYRSICCRYKRLEVLAAFTNAVSFASRPASF
jgi:zinc transporter 5/7